MEPVLLPRHQEVEDQLALAQRQEDVMALEYGTLEVDFGSDFQSQRRAGSKTIDFRLGDVGLDRSHFGLEDVVDQPTRMERVVDALAEIHAPMLPAGVDRRYSLIVDDKEAFAYSMTTSFSGEPIRNRIPLDQGTQDRIIAMRDDPEGRDFSPIRVDPLPNNMVDASKAPFAHDVAVGADARLEAALNAPPPSTAGILGQASALGKDAGTAHAIAKGPQAAPRHDPVGRGRGHGR